jgi:UDPglucose 6-dehydrogenase
MKKLLVGFIGQGFIGKNMADNFEKRGYSTVRYSLDKKFIKNRDLIKNCDIVFIAVPTPTTPRGFDDSIIRKTVKLVGEDKIAVIKSTILPGTTSKIQKENPKLYIMHSPEFLTEANVVFETANPQRNIVGIPENNRAFKEKAGLVMSLLPKSSYSLICSSSEAELIKYAGNNFLYLKVVFINILYDYSRKIATDWSKIAEAVSQDPRIRKSHISGGGHGKGSGW